MIKPKCPLHGICNIHDATLARLRLQYHVLKQQSCHSAEQLRVANALARQKLYTEVMENNKDNHNVIYQLIGQQGKGSKHAPNVLKIYGKTINDH